jgi:preprotein translocase subunit SecD
MIFITGLLLVGVLSLIYSSRALADLIFYTGPSEGFRSRVVLKPGPTARSDMAILETDLLDAGQVVARRLDQLNMSASYHLISSEDQLAIMLPENEKMPYVINIITHVGEIEFIDGGAESPPLGQRVETGPQANGGQGLYPVLFTGQEIEAVVPPDSTTGQIFYRLALSPIAADRFARFVQDQPRHYVCMVMDKEVINCSGMYHWSNNTLDILPNLGSGTVISLADLAIFLESGPLPIPLKVDR